MWPSLFGECACRVFMMVARVCRGSSGARGNQPLGACRTLMTAEGSRWWSMVCHSSEVCSWQWTPLWSAVRGDGQPQRRASDRDAVALNRARKKETTCHELVRPGSRARFVVPTLEVGGRWSEEVRTFVQLLAQSEPLSTRRRMEQAPALVFGLVLCRRSAGFCCITVVEVTGQLGKCRPPMKWSEHHAGLCG